MQEYPSLILVTGSLSRDRVVFQGESRDAPGGVVWHAGHTLLALGIGTRVLTRTAEPDRAPLRTLSEHGAEVCWSSSKRSTALILEYAPERSGGRRLGVESLAEPIGPDLLEPALRDATVLYLGPLHAGDIDPACIPLIRRRGPGLVALDVQGLVRRFSGDALVAEPADGLEDWLSVVQVVKASEDEARLVCPAPDAEGGRLTRLLAQRVPGREVIVTGGERGAWAAAGGELHHARAAPVPGDPTGAGDVFFAAWLSRRVSGADAAAAADFAADHVADWLRRGRPVT